MVTNIRPAADSFERIVNNLAGYAEVKPIDFETTFLAGSAPLNVWKPMPGCLVLRLMSGELDEHTFEEKTLRTVGIIPGDIAGGEEELAVVEGPVILGEFKTWRAAVSFALERVCASNWSAGAQAEHDNVAV